MAAIRRVLSDLSSDQKVRALLPTVVNARAARWSTAASAARRTKGTSERYTHIITVSLSLFLFLLFFHTLFHCGASELSCA